ncbi:MAG: hypothetical protein RDU76_06155 [Candidatus Edwardsbacteria bacterium]|nr:hypothetical protein [Candidatus Edwardsbacteria bacterium]
MKKPIIILSLLLLGWSLAFNICDRRAQDEHLYPNSSEINIFSKWYANQAGNPWQYRVFNNFLILSLHSLLPKYCIPLDVFKKLQVMLLILLVYYYLSALTGAEAYGLTLLFGFVLFAASIRSNLAFDTYWDLAFYLVGFILLQKGRFWYLVPLTFLGALNRETYLFFVLAVGLLSFRHSRLRAPALASAAVFGAVYFLLRHISPDQQANVGYMGISYGWQMFKSNFRPSGLFFSMHLLAVCLAGVKAFLA